MMRLLVCILVALIGGQAWAQESKPQSIDDVAKWIYVQKEKANRAEQEETLSNASITVHSGSYGCAPSTPSLGCEIVFTNNSTKPITELTASVTCNLLKLPKSNTIKLQSAVNPHEKGVLYFPITEAAKRPPLQRHDKLKVFATIVGGRRIELHRDLARELRGKNYTDAEIARTCEVLARKDNLFGWAYAEFEKEVSTQYFQADLDNASQWQLADIVAALQRMKDSKNVHASRGIEVIEADHTQWLNKPDVETDILLQNNSVESVKDITLTFTVNGKTVDTSEVIHLPSPIKPKEQLRYSYLITAGIPDYQPRAEYANDHYRPKDADPTLYVSVNGAGPFATVRRIDQELIRDLGYTEVQIKTGVKQYVQEKSLLGWAYANVGPSAP